VEQKLAEALPNFHLVTLPVVGEVVSDERGVVFVGDVVLGVAGGEDDRSAHGNSGVDEGGFSYVLVIDQGLVDSVERTVRNDLAGGVVSFAVEGSFRGGCRPEVAGDFTFGFGVPWLFFLRFSHPWTLVECVSCSVGRCGWAAGVLALSAYERVLLLVLVIGLLLF